MSLLSLRRRQGGCEHLRRRGWPQLLRTLRSGGRTRGRHTDGCAGAQTRGQPWLRQRRASPGGRYHGRRAKGADTVACPTPLCAGAGRLKRWLALVRRRCLGWQGFRVGGVGPGPAPGSRVLGEGWRRCGADAASRVGIHGSRVARRCRREEAAVYDRRRRGGKGRGKRRAWRRRLLPVRGLTRPRRPGRGTRRRERRSRGLSVQCKLCAPWDGMRGWRGLPRLGMQRSEPGAAGTVAAKNVCAPFTLKPPFPKYLRARVAHCLC